ncbi:GGDEF domain-containing protein [Acidovorax sp. sif1233]|uniref:sensor domain-containing diguanylate cyclase n=1 Tax=Acidovorax sp. sif1233 TaxID=2854792 RepID=UPI001C48AC9D|nr:GGDEF domain-containing protein [Acidovorax sp. sif1233]MBV7454813.1 GGDEF domain-containing protein [Acidovorax sp. sif1233]
MDPITIFIVATLMMLANGWVLGLMRNDFPEALRPSAGTWRTATLLLAASAVLYAVQYRLPLGLASPMANGLVLLGCTGYWRALRQFYGLPDRLWLLAPAIVGIGGIAWFAIARPHTGMRVLILSGSCAFLLLACFALLASQKSHDGARSRRVMASLFAAVAAFTVFRAGYFLLKGVSPSFDVTGDGAWINMASPMITAILPVVGTTGFLLMCSQRIGRQWELAASTDYLTGLANRRTLVAVGEQRFAQAGARGGGLALALIDIDHFKAINDCHGHAVGDVALRHVAGHLQASCSGADFAARHGGEEFVVLWDAADSRAARAAGERLRRLVATRPLSVDGLPLAMTISLGVALKNEGDSSFDELLHRADEALYAAKTGGRNRVEVAG